MMRRGKVEVDMSGLNQLRERLDSVAGTHEVSLPELMPVSFMQQHTQFSSIDEMLAAGKLNGKKTLMRPNGIFSSNPILLSMGGRKC